MRLPYLVAGLSAMLLVAAAPAAETTFEQILRESLPSMGATAIPDREKGQQALQDACYLASSPGHEAERAAACQAMAGALRPDTAKPARLWLIYQLEFIGRGECIAALDAQLDDGDAEIREAARRALQNNPAPQATERLIARVAGAKDPVVKTAFVASLGARKDAAAVTALASLLTEPVAVTAAESLGRTASGDDMAKILATSTARAPEVIVALAHAAIHCAQRELTAGNKAAAGRLYALLAKTAQPKPIERAVLRGQVLAADDPAAVIQTYLASADAEKWAIVAQCLGDACNADLAAKLAAQLPSLAAEPQLLVLGALAARGEKAALPTALAAAKSNDPRIATAGFRALAKMGDGSAVPALLAAALSNSDSASAARESLIRLTGEGVDEALVSALAADDVARRKLVIDILDGRKTPIAVPALLKEAQSTTAEIRSRVVKALGNLAQPKDVPALVALLLATPAGRDRDDWEKAVMFVCNRIDDEQGQAEPVLALLGSASASDRRALLPVLGRIGGKMAFAAVQAHIASNDADTKEAAVRALCNWPDASVADELLKLAGSADDANHRVWALRAYVRVISLPGEVGNDKKTLAMFQKAMDMATRDEDKRFIVGRVSAVRSIKALRWALPYLDNPTLANDAARSVLDLAHRKELFEPNRQECTAAITRIAETSKDARIVEHAKRMLKGL